MARQSGRGVRRLVGIACVLLATSMGAVVANGYDVTQQGRFVSIGAWTTQSTMTNTTSWWVTWRVTLSSRRCQELTGAVQLALEARLATQRSSCATITHEFTTQVEPRGAATLLRRPVTHYDYYFIRKLDRAGRVVSSGYATLSDSFTDFAYASY